MSPRTALASIILANFSLGAIQHQHEVRCYAFTTPAALLGQCSSCRTTSSAATVNMQARYQHRSPVPSTSGAQHLPTGLHRPSRSKPSMSWLTAGTTSNFLGRGNSDLSVSNGATALDPESQRGANSGDWGVRMSSVVGGGVKHSTARTGARSVNWPLWYILPIAPYQKRKTIMTEVVPGKVGGHVSEDLLNLESAIKILQCHEVIYCTLIRTGLIACSGVGWDYHRGGSIRFYNP